MDHSFSFKIWDKRMLSDFRRIFIGDETWPVAAESLAALSDLGVPDEKIAEMFEVEAGKVVALRARYGLQKAARGDAPPDDAH